jgi:hypothetical protein
VLGGLRTHYEPRRAHRAFLVIVIITRNGQSYVALIDARRLEHYHRLEREHIHLALLNEVESAWDDVEAGRTLTMVEGRAKYAPKKRKR